MEDRVWQLLQHACRQLEMPPPRGFEAVYRGTVDTFRVALDDGPPAWFRIARASVGLSAVLQEQMAVQMLWAHGEDRTPAGYRVTRVGEVAVAAHHEPQGRFAVELLGSPALNGLSEDAGRWMAKLPDRPHHGLYGDGTTLRPRTATWTDDLKLELARYRAVIGEAGLGLGPVEDQLAALVDGLQVRPRTWRLVHRDLTPERMLHVDGRLSCVVGWERAWLADPVYAFASLVLLPEDALKATLQGYGDDSVLEAPQLQAYAALEVLGRLAMRALALLPGGARHLGAAQATARTEAARVLDKDWARQGAPPVPDAAEVLLRRQLRLLAERDRLLPDAFEEALAATLVGDQLQGELRNSWLKLADTVTTRLEERWRRPMPAHPVDPPTSQRGETALCDRARMLYDAALERVGPIDPAVRTGMHVRLHTLAHRDVGAHCPPIDRLRHALARTVYQPEEPERLQDLYDLCTAFKDTSAAPWEEVAETVSLRRGAALIAARTLEDRELAVAPLAIVAQIPA